MDRYRNGVNDSVNPVCGSSGCILGHMTAFAEEPLPRYKESTLEALYVVKGNIDFDEFAKTELNISRDSSLWAFLFSSSWAIRRSQELQIEEAIERIDKACELKWDEYDDQWDHLIVEFEAKSKRFDHAN